MKTMSQAMVVMLAAIALQACAMDVATSEPVQVGVDKEALTDTFDYVNSNNNAGIYTGFGSFMGYLPLPYAMAIRCEAMRYHTQAGHNYWSCSWSGTDSSQVWCEHYPMNGSGVRRTSAICQDAWNPTKQSKCFIRDDYQDAFGISYESRWYGGATDDSQTIEYRYVDEQGNGVGAGRCTPHGGWGNGRMEYRSCWKSGGVCPDWHQW